MKHHTDWRIHYDSSHYVLHFISPTGHRYSRKRHQVTPPDIWMTSPATAAAGRLDVIAASPARPETPVAAASVTEELLTAELLRRNLTPRPIEYVEDSGRESTGVLPLTDPRDDDPPF